MSETFFQENFIFEVLRDALNFPKLQEAVLIFSDSVLSSYLKGRMIRNESDRENYVNSFQNQKHVLLPSSFFLALRKKNIGTSTKILTYQLGIRINLCSVVFPLTAVQTEDSAMLKKLLCNFFEYVNFNEDSFEAVALIVTTSTNSSLKQDVVGKRLAKFLIQFQGDKKSAHIGQVCKLLSKIIEKENYSIWKKPTADEEVGSNVTLLHDFSRIAKRRFQWIEPKAEEVDQHSGVGFYQYLEDLLKDVLNKKILPILQEKESLKIDFPNVPLFADFIKLAEVECRGKKTSPINLYRILRNIFKSLSEIQKVVESDLEAETTFLSGVAKALAEYKQSDSELQTATVFIDEGIKFYNRYGFNRLHSMDSIRKNILTPFYEKNGIMELINVEYKYEASFKKGQKNSYYQSFAEDIKQFPKLVMRSNLQRLANMDNLKTVLDFIQMMLKDQISRNEVILREALQVTADAFRKASEFQKHLECLRLLKNPFNIKLLDYYEMLVRLGKCEIEDGREYIGCLCELTLFDQAKITCLRLRELFTVDDTFQREFMGVLKKEQEYHAQKVPVNLPSLEPLQIEQTRSALSKIVSEGSQS